MRTRPCVLGALALLGACGDQPETAPEAALAETAPAAYRAGGNEPFWAVTVANGEMRLERPDFPPLSAPVTLAEATPDGLRYESPALTLFAAHNGCTDSMSGFGFPDTVTVILAADDLALEGCGGDRIPETGNP